MRVCWAPAAENIVSINTRAEARETRTVSGERRELLGGAVELEVLGAGARGEARGLPDGGLGHGDDLGAVDQVVAVVSEHGELGDGRPEAVGHELLLVDEALPEAGRARVAREGEVGLETHLAGVVAAALRERRGDLADVVSGSGESFALEKDLEEDLGVESEGSLWRRSVRRR